ncbi:ABC transporter permease [Mesoterricola sediminis]|uniref:Multidrug ABC transporter substrate-binding protein n=1 Tax=Mesoterricola sediminis TaxID=2927980 RepID=A0AA48GMM3_9BACT|nr:ABC transporter permease [Mesoterricola sediminis]BDU75881.1 multidrug ABC transporter substrate-binding protein [Mesoterricola sediminis]
MIVSGAFRERLLEAWAEIRENLGRSVLQALGVILGVASVLGGFSISDSMRAQSSRLYVKLGGLDKLNIQPNAIVKDGQPTALQAANLGLRHADAEEGADLGAKSVAGVAVRRMARARTQTPTADQDRQITGIGADFIPLEGYAIAQGRAFSATELEQGDPVAILGAEAVETFFPDGDAVGRVITVGGKPLTVVGTFQERVFRFREDQHNIFQWRNRIIATPASFVQKRLQGDRYQRTDRVTFRLPEMGAIRAFSRDLTSLLKANHRLQDDFRLDDVSARLRKQESQESVYNIVFLLSGVLALIGGGIVNVNIQMASLKERVREVGVKMAIGASGLEVFKTFMTEALLLTALGAAAGLTVGIAFSWTITYNLGVPLAMSPSSFLWAIMLAGVFGFAFALYPAWKASRLSPMEALRYE